MPELEVIRVLASITQVTDRGTKLSVKPCSFYCSVKSTDQSLQCLSSDVSLTCCILKELSKTLEQDDKLCSEQALSTARDVFDKCNSIFEQIENAIDEQNHGSEKNCLIRTPKKSSYVSYSTCADLEMLKVNLEKLKSTTLLILNIIIYGRQIRQGRTTLELKHQRGLIQSFLKNKSEIEAIFYDVNKTIQPVNIEVDESRCQPSSSTNIRHSSTEKWANASNLGGRHKVARLLNMARSRLAAKAHSRFEGSNFDAHARTDFPEIPCHTLRNEHILDIQGTYRRPRVPSIVESNDPNASNGEGNSGSPRNPSQYLFLQGSPASISAIDADFRGSELHSPEMMSGSKQSMSTNSSLSSIETMDETADKLILQWTNLTREELPVE